MSAHFKQIQSFSSLSDAQHFAEDVLTGLTGKNKHLASKYFYDEQGSQLFNKITRHPDYYLTQCELAIIKQCKKTLSSLLNQTPFNLIELGPGEGVKTQLLISQFLQDHHQFSYYPIDISQKFLAHLVNEFNQQQPDLEVTALNGDYFKGLEWLKHHSKRRNVVLFLGSSIGNFEERETHFFLHGIWHDLQPNDYLFIGFDLQKRIDVLLKAYDDNAHITRDFNLNILQRINRELQADFNLNQFEHYATYNVYRSAMESYLISLTEQMVSIKSLGQTVQFKAFEPLHLEYSYKYNLSQIEQFATNNGFTIVMNFYDPQHYFVNSLWKVNK